MSAPAVLITGAAGGIGSATARGYARLGARLALIDIDAAGVEALAGALVSDGHEAVALSCDVTDPQACRDAVTTAIELLGGLDVLVANAGRTHLGFVDGTDPSVFRRIMDVNFFGAVHATHAALPALKLRRGRIAVVSSVAGFAPLIGRAGYAASKHALHGFFESLRCEIAADGVGVTIICPSFVRTGIGGSAIGPDGGPALEARTEFGEPMEPDVVAEAIIRGVSRGRRLVLPGSVGKLAWIVSRLAPRVYEGIMVRRLARRTTFAFESGDDRQPRTKR